jgi:hypothetical protein
MAVTSNILLGLWIFCTLFLQHVGQQDKKMLLGVMVPSIALGQRRKMKLQSSVQSLKTIFYDASMCAISKSWVFFFGGMLITRPASWKRNIGLILTTAYSLYLAIFSQFLPWTNYFNMFANLLYISAGALTSNNKNSNSISRAGSIQEYLEDEFRDDYTNT